MPRVTTDRGIDRLVNFTDAVVAVAVTLLILPIADLVQEGDTVADLFTTYSSQLISYVAVFLLMVWIWTGHHRFWELMDDYNYPLLWLNTIWLLLLSLFPVIAGFTFRGLEHGQGIAYLSLLALITLVKVFMTLYSRSRKSLISPSAEPGDFVVTMDLWRAACYAMVAGLIAIWPAEVDYLIWLVIPLITLTHVVESPRKRSPTDNPEGE